MYKLSERWRKSVYVDQVPLSIALAASVLLQASCNDGTRSPANSSGPTLATSESIESDIGKAPDTEPLVIVSDNEPGNSQGMDTIDSGIPVDTSAPGAEDGLLLQGFFVDDMVQGLAYATNTQYGFTGPLGEFSYLAGEDISFYIGDPFITGEAWDLGSAPAEALMTPLQLSSAQWINGRVTNLLRVLQSLDTDSNTANGIQLPSPEVNLPDGSGQLNFSEPVGVFQQNSTLLSYVSSSTSQSVTLVDADQAIEHFQNVLNRQLPPPSGSWVLTEPELSGDLPSGLKASITFLADGYVLATVALDDIEAQVYGSYTQSGLRFNVEYDRISLITSQLQLVAEKDDPQWYEVNSALDDLLPAPMKVAIGIDARLSRLPDLISIESSDRNIQLRYVESEVSVDEEVAYLTIEPTQVNLVSIGDQVQVYVSAHSIDASTLDDVQFIWSSSDESVVTVSNSGVITAIGTGSAIVSVQSVTVNATITVQVQAVEVQETEPVVVTQCTSTENQQGQNFDVSENTSTISQVNLNDNPDQTEQVNNYNISQNGNSSTVCD